MSVLVDSSAWVDYFRDKRYGDTIDLLIDETVVVINDLILAELCPALLVQEHSEIVGLLREIERCPLVVDWKDVIWMQTICLRNGINRIVIPDLLIAQNAIQNDVDLLSSDKHFKLMSEHFPLSLY